MKHLEDCLGDFARMTEEVWADPLNELRKRTVENTVMDLYNCAGYAFGCFSWYAPWDDPGYYVGPPYLVTQEAIKIILHDFPNVRRIHDISEVKPNERAVAFRIDGGTAPMPDFHCIVRNKDGIWTHKRGSRWLIEDMPEKEALSKCWNDHDGKPRYTGPLVLFAVQREDI